MSIDSYSYSDLRQLLAGEKTITLGELRELTKELLQHIIRRREQANRTVKRAEFVTEDTTPVTLDTTLDNLSEEELNDIIITL